MLSPRVTTVYISCTRCECLRTCLHDSSFPFQESTERSQEFTPAAHAAATAAAKTGITHSFVILRIKQGGRPVSRDGYAPVSFLVPMTSQIRTQGRRQESPAGGIETDMKTFHEWLAMREGLWLNDRIAVIGRSWLNPLPKNSAVNKSLPKKPAKTKPMLVDVHAFDSSVSRLTIHVSKDGATTSGF